MTRVRILPVLFVVGALVIGAGTLQAADHAGTLLRAGQEMATSPAQMPRVTEAAPRFVDGPARARQSAQRIQAPVSKLVSPRRSAGLHMTFPRTWRPAAVEVGSPVPRPPLRVFCATCPPGTVLEVDL
jgi:hypothetical protein